MCPWDSLLPNKKRGRRISLNENALNVISYYLSAIFPYLRYTVDGAKGNGLELREELKKWKVRSLTRVSLEWSY